MFFHFLRAAGKLVINAYFHHIVIYSKLFQFNMVLYHPTVWRHSKVSEWLFTGSFVYGMTALDADTGVNAQIKYSLSPANSDFTIDADSGAIYTKQRLSSSSSGVSTYQLTINASDQVRLFSAWFSNTINASSVRELAAAWIMESFEILKQQFSLDLACQEAYLS